MVSKVFNTTLKVYGEINKYMFTLQIPKVTLHVFISTRVNTLTVYNCTMSGTCITITCMYMHVCVRTCV